MQRLKKVFTVFLAMVLVISAVSILTACSSPATNNTANGERKSLVVAMELAYPPFEAKDNVGNPSGLSVDFITEFAEAYNYDIVIENTAWDGLIPSLQTGMADCVISSMTITEERSKQVSFSDPYALAQLALLTNSSSGIKNIDDLNQAGRSIAVKTGSTGDVYATKNLTNVTIVRLADESACVTEVVQGKVDAFIYDQLTIYRNQLKNPKETSAVFIPFQDPEYWGVAVQKDNRELLAELNDFIATSRQNGTFDQLTEKHLAEEHAVFKKLGFRWFFDFD